MEAGPPSVRRSGDHEARAPPFAAVKRESSPPPRQTPRNDIDQIAQEYGDFLLQERSLLPASVGSTWR